MTESHHFLGHVTDESCNPPDCNENPDQCQYHVLTLITLRGPAHISIQSEHIGMR